MATNESIRLRNRLDALTWRLREANDDLERTRRDIENVEQDLQNARVAHLLGEEGADDIQAAAARSEHTHSQLANEESLVQRLEQRRAQVNAEYRKALSEEWARRIAERLGAQQDPPANR